MTNGRRGLEGTTNVSEMDEGTTKKLATLSNFIGGEDADPGRLAFAARLAPIVCLFSRLTDSPPAICAAAPLLFFLGWN